MSIKYTNYCMQFNNDELLDDFIKKFDSYQNLFIKCLTEDEEEIDFSSNKKIETILFDESEKIFITFYGYQTSIYISDIEIMFIDESTINTYTSSDVYNNILFEGKLREMSHKQILQMFCKLISCFFDSQDIVVKEILDESIEHKYFSAYKYFIQVINHNNLHKQYVINNLFVDY